MATLVKQPSMAGVHMSVNDVLKATRSETLATRVKAADIDNDGTISVAEFLNMVSSEVDSKSSASRRFKLALGLLLLLLLSLAANAGLTYAVIDANKETSVDNGKLMSKDGNSLVSTANAQFTRADVRDVLLNLQPDNATVLNTMVVSNSNGSWVTFDVCRVEIYAPNELVAVNSCDGMTLMAVAANPEVMVYDSIDEAEAVARALLAEEPSATEAEAGRRLMVKGGNGGGGGNPKNFIVIGDCTESNPC